MQPLNAPPLAALSRLFLPLERLRTGRALVGPKDGANVSFLVPDAETFAHDPPAVSIQVYHNGLRLAPLEEYALAESGGEGAGFDTVVLVAAPQAGDRLVADYVTGAT